MKNKPRFRFSKKTFAVPYIIFLFIFVVLPLVLVLVNAFIADGQLSLENFVRFITEGTYLKTFANSLVYGFVTTVACLIIGYPVAYFLAKHFSGMRFLVLLFVIPMWVNFLIRTLTLKTIFNAVGVPLGQGALIIGLIYDFLPYMILPLHTAISGIDRSYGEAARDLGADPVGVFIKTTLPLSIPGIVSGITMVFIPAISTFAISEFLTTNQIQLFGDLIDDMFAHESLYGIGSVMSLVMMIFVLLSNVIMSKLDVEAETGAV